MFHIILSNSHPFEIYVRAVAQAPISLGLQTHANSVHLYESIIYWTDISTMSTQFPSHGMG